jgi:hypothetical protein
MRGYLPVFIGKTLRWATLAATNGANQHIVTPHEVLRQDLRTTS